MRRKGLVFNIETKLLISFVLIAFIPIFILYFTSNYLVATQLYKSQNERVEVMKDNIMTTLRGEVDTLHADNIDYAHWSEMYDAVEEKDMQWFKDVFTIISSPQKNVELIYVLDRNARVVYNNKEIPEFFEDASRMISLAKKGKEFSSLASIGNDLYFISFTRIIDYENLKHENGILVFGKKVIIDHLDKLPKSSSFSYDIIHKGNALIESSSVKEYTEYLNSARNEKKKSNKIATLYEINDYMSDTIAMLLIRETGNFVEDTTRNIRKGLITSAVTIYLLSLVFLYIIKNNIMGPITNLRQRINNLRGRGAALLNAGGDELAALTEEFDAMSNEILKHSQEIEDKNKELEYLVYKDDIIGAYNKRYFRSFLPELFEEAEASNTTLSLLLIDIDHFRHYCENINRYEIENTLNIIHCIIDDVIMQAEDDYNKICFDGTDEFRIIMIGMDYKDALVKADEIAKRISEYKFYGVEKLPKGYLSVSCGLANYPKDAADHEKLYEAAKDRLTRTKYHNQGRIGYFYSIFNSLKHDIDENKKAITYMSKAFLSVIDAMDEYTYTHTEGVVKYTDILSKELNLSEQEKENLRIGALLHDIGKLELGREILNKKDKLTAEDIKLIKLHPIFGVNMLKSLEYFDDVIDMVKYHHEKYDGTGYPEGLKGEAIPLGARIIAVADSFDAMTTTRAYRTTHKSYQQAMEELVKCSGTQFDPSIVEAFVNFVEKNGYNFLVTDSIQ